VDCASGELGNKIVIENARHPRHGVAVMRPKITRIRMDREHVANPTYVSGGTAIVERIHDR
jgi:hypothetical protein